MEFGIHNKPVFKGEILLCDDNELMQSIIKSLLIDLGFDVTVASNGKECVDIVAARLKNGGELFGLIFMDIYMPVMGGLEAAETLAQIGNKSPVAALTANTETGDVEKYKTHNIKNSLNKPVNPEELRSFLLTYFTPQGFAEERISAAEEDEKRKRLLTGFVKRNRTTYTDICSAIESGDVKLAHRLAHTLKGMAGLMGNSGLMEAAHAVEASLAENTAEHLENLLSVLERELKSTLDELSPLLDEINAQKPDETALSKDKAEALFEELEALLRADSAKCKGFAGDLRRIPGTAELIEQIENYEFEKALEILAELKGSERVGK